MSNIAGKWALVTGASRGIGQQIGICLAQHGVNVVLHGRKKENMAATLKMLEPFDVKTHVAAAELNSEAGALSLVEQVKASVGSVDIIYNNAGVQNEWKEVWELSIAEWKELFQINLFSVVAISNGLIPEMVKKGFGRVIVTTSGIQDCPQMTPYSVSKAAVDKYCLDMAAELKDSGVLINALDPGWLRTDLGGPDGEHPVESVIPGALAPLLTDGVILNGKSYHAHDYKKL